MDGFFQLDHLLDLSSSLPPSQKPSFILVSACSSYENTLISVYALSDTSILLSFSTSDSPLSVRYLPGPCSRLCTPSGLSITPDGTTACIITESFECFSFPLPCFSPSTVSVPSPPSTLFTPLHWGAFKATATSLSKVKSTTRIAFSSCFHDCLGHLHLIVFPLPNISQFWIINTVIGSVISVPFSVKFSEFLSGSIISRDDCLVFMFQVEVEDRQNTFALKLTASNQSNQNDSQSNVIGASQIDPQRGQLMTSINPPSIVSHLSNHFFCRLIKSNYGSNTDSFITIKSVKIPFSSQKRLICESFDLYKSSPFNSFLLSDVTEPTFVIPLAFAVLIVSISGNRSIITGLSLTKAMKNAQNYTSADQSHDVDSQLFSISFPSNVYVRGYFLARKKKTKLSVLGDFGVYFWTSTGIYLLSEISNKRGWFEAQLRNKNFQFVDLLSDIRFSVEFQEICYQISQNLIGKARNLLQSDQSINKINDLLMESVDYFFKSKRTDLISFLEGLIFDFSAFNVAFAFISCHEFEFVSSENLSETQFSSLLILCCLINIFKDQDQNKSSKLKYLPFTSETLSLLASVMSLKIDSLPPKYEKIRLFLLRIAKSCLFSQFILDNYPVELPIQSEIYEFFNQTHCLNSNNLISYYIMKNLLLKRIQQLPSFIPFLSNALQSKLTELTSITSSLSVSVFRRARAQSVAVFDPQSANQSNQAIMPAHLHESHLISSLIKSNQTPEVSLFENCRIFHCFSTLFDFERFHIIFELSKHFNLDHQSFIYLLLVGGSIERIIEEFFNCLNSFNVFESYYYRLLEAFC
ncbi:hypothetical protein P9112_003482 [Eukaryota sp. TZLM1-RC]